MFNLSLRTGIFPDDWKFAKVTPIYKSEDKTLCENYRPISVISNIAKIFEKLVCRQLNTFLNNNNILSIEIVNFQKHIFEKSKITFHTMIFEAIFRFEEMRRIDLLWEIVKCRASLL